MGLEARRQEANHSRHRTLGCLLPCLRVRSVSSFQSLSIVEEVLRIAQAVRDACRMATLRAYEDAGRSGLCHEGRWECAGEAIRTLDRQALVQTLTSPATRVS